VALPFRSRDATRESHLSFSASFAKRTGASAEPFPAALPGLSIIVPTLNEEGSVSALADRIDAALTSREIPYELVFVDDHSTDNTREQIELLAENYPVQLHLKKGSRGKAQSLLQGFACARYELLAMIDADLQYPPESVPEMVEQIHRANAGVVVAKRTRRKTTPTRRLFSDAFSALFVRLLHGLTCDAQSGLKVFRREVLDAIWIEQPSPWAFDLDFLLQARDAGFQIGEADIVFEERYAGRSKVGLLSTSWQIGWSALELKFRRSNIGQLFRDPHTRKDGGFQYRGQSYLHHSSVPMQETAFRRLLPKQIFIVLAVMVFLAGSLWIDWRTSLTAIIAVVTVLYFCDLAFSFFLIYQAFAHSELMNIDSLPGDAERDWPTYTILCPLYHEHEVLPQFVTAITRLEYPKDRIEVLLLLEEDDNVTLKAAAALALPSYFSVVRVPHSLPKTKPKACNYGLRQASGAYVVIYDAEDVPHPQQLKKAVLAFEQSPPSIVCIQARLNFYNPNQNLLTRLFAAEYSLWFDLILPGLQACNCPIPLGGTSNHFKRSALQALGGWDAFNVTEDCDLGVRLAKRGFRTAILDSTTLEEANSELRNWFPQRTRWLKGYVQTYFVHMRFPRAFGPRSWREPKLWAFQLIVGGKVFSMLVNPLMWALTFSYFALRPAIGSVIESFFPAPVLYIGVTCLVFGNFLSVYYYMVGCARRGHDDLIKYIFVAPLYWAAISVAAWMAVYKFARQPHYWAKTSHGLHLGNRDGLAEAESTVGQLVDGTLLEHREVVPVSIGENESEWVSPIWTLASSDQPSRDENGRAS
jgi:glycosyltransferase XagB